MKFIIWGAGIRGERVYRRLGPERVEAFLDTNHERLDKMFCGKKIISLDEYEKDYSNFLIIIAFLHEDEGVYELEKRGIDTYLLLSECPGEFQEANVRDFIKEYIQSSVQADVKYGIYGHTLYSILLYEWLEECGCRSPYLIAESNIPCGIEKILVAQGYRYIVSKEIKENLFDCILNSKNTLDNFFKEKLLNVKKRDIFDCVYEIEAYHNKKLDKFKDLHKGEKCFIIATGPSLRMEDLELLRENKITCISMNFIWKAFSMTEWRPNYYMAEDCQFLDAYGMDIDKIDSEYMFVGDTSQDFWNKEHKDNMLWHHVSAIYFKDSIAKFSKDFSRVCYAGGTVTYSCMQLAAYMGFKEIYLLGVDFSYSNANNNEIKHFYNENNTGVITYSDIQLTAYKKAREFADQNGFKIYNATRGGNLEVFERVDFDSLF